MSIEPPTTTPNQTGRGTVLYLLRATIGGIFMGLANLVPGISGGTMLLAAGVYPDFVESIALVTRFTRRVRPWLVLASIVVPAVAAIGLLAGPVRDVVLTHRWIAYSLFIGLTLGGAPTLWRLLRPISSVATTSAAIACLGMIVLALSQQSESAADATSAVEWGLAGLALAGFAGAAAMVLPGVSGGYLLLLMGQYVAVLDAISTFRQAIAIRSVSGLINASIPLVAIGVGVVLGVVVVSNLIRWLLKRYREATLGALLGLLLGAVAGLWPFRMPVPPPVGAVIDGVTVISEDHARTMELKRWPTRSFTPGPLEILGSVGLVVVGFGVSISVGWLGASARENTEETDPARGEDAGS